MWEDGKASVAMKVSERETGIRGLETVTRIELLYIPHYVSI
jgi:hypothetical protein